ncbi:CDP-alcohol phosphatidyltransferase family protein [Candidatus Uabimicrobium sp. HlEnr_7]|uniref:CDP-alcohol phosphatidyltransferase family protein n=1 Tax=Candidatus Uabimicrobium helgolandensis TaxID=3095367 RepID=UPI003558536E
MEEYKYTVDEKSLMQGFLTQFVWKPIVQCLPTKLKPNTITIFGFFCMLLSGVSVYLTFYGHNWAFLTATLLLFIYTASDNIDGMHARSTGQSSRLGEFLDHWLDSFSCIVVNMGMAIVLGLHGWILALYCISIGIAFFCTIWEHHYTGVFHSGRLGTNEGLFMVMGVYLAAFIFQRPSWLQYDGTTTHFVTIAIIFAMIISFYTALRCILRVRKNLWECILLLFAMFTIAAANYLLYIPDVLAAVLILAYNTMFCGKLFVEHLVQKTSPYRHSITLLLTLLAIIVMVFGMNIFPYVLYGAFVFAGIALLLDGARGIYYLR